MKASNLDFMEFATPAVKRLSRLAVSLCAAAVILLGVGQAQATPVLFQYGFEIDGAIGGNDATFFGGSFGSFGSAPAGVVLNLASGTGLGTVTVTVTGAGTHHVGFFADYDITESNNTAFNEVGGAFGTVAGGQKWELAPPLEDDSPFSPACFICSDLDFQSLTSSSFLSGTGINGADDVSMALSHDFILAANEVGAVTFVLGASDPGVFHLKQTDVTSGENIFFSSSFVIVPEPGALAIFVVGLVGLGLTARRRRDAVRS